jgi:hypothetical protein
MPVEMVLIGTKHSSHLVVVVVQVRSVRRQTRRPTDPVMVVPV